MPVLGHCDVQLVGPQLQPLGRSLVQRFGGLPSGPDQLTRLLTSNFVTGCTMLLNRELLDLVTPLPGNVVLHDWWCALCAVTLGRIAFLPESLLQYRQHANNTVGGPAVGRWYQHFQSIPRRARRFSRNLAAAVVQLQALQQRIDEFLSGTAAPDSLLSAPDCCVSPHSQRGCLGQRETDHLLKLQQFLHTLAARPVGPGRFSALRDLLSEQQSHGLKWSIRNLLASAMLSWQRCPSFAPPADSFSKIRNTPGRPSWNRAA